MKEPAASLHDGEHFRSKVLIAFCASVVTIYFGADNRMGSFAASAVCRRHSVAKFKVCLRKTCKMRYNGKL